MREFGLFNLLKNDTGDIYTPPSPDYIKTRKVQSIELPCSEALEQGWRFKRKSRKRMRITHFRGSERNVIVPSVIDGHIVNEIGNAAFFRSDIDSLEIPNTVKKLGINLCLLSKVKKVLFEEGLEILPNSAFERCFTLENVYLPTTLVKIGDRAFFDCHALKNINIPDNCRRVGEKAFCESGLESLSMPHNCIMNGEALSDTPLHRKYKIIRRPYGDNAFHVLLVGTSVTEPVSIKLSKENVFLEEKSVLYNCTIDLSGCQKVSISNEAFRYDRNKWGTLFSHAYGKLIMPFGSKGEYIPELTEAYYPDGRKYIDALNIKMEGDGSIIADMTREELPSFSITYKAKHITVNSNKRLRFYEYAVSSSALEDIHISSPDFMGWGELFSLGCRCLHLVEWNGLRVYIPSGELVSQYLHEAVLKAFAGNYRDFFDSSVIDRIFTEEDTVRYKRKDTDRKKPVRLSQATKIIIAADVLRSTPSLFKNRKMYEDYLWHHRTYAWLIIGALPRSNVRKLPEEYAEFLKKFYKL